MRAHEWTVIAEFDAGYVLGRCQVCGTQDLLEVSDLLPAPRSAASHEVGERPVAAPA